MKRIKEEKIYKRVSALADLIRENTCGLVNRENLATASLVDGWGFKVIEDEVSIGYRKGNGNRKVKDGEYIWAIMVKRPDGLEMRASAWTMLSTLWEQWLVDADKFLAKLAPKLREKDGRDHN